MMARFPEIATLDTLMLETTLRSLLFAGLLGACLAALRVRHVPIRKAAWTIVLAASLAMPALMRWPLLTELQGRLAWAVPTSALEHAFSAAWRHEFAPEPIRVTALQALPDDFSGRDAQIVSTQPASKPAKIQRDEPPAVSAAARVVDSGTPQAQTSLPPAAPALQSAAAAAPPAIRFSWPALSRMLAWTYLAMAAALMLRLLLGLVAAVRLWASAQPVSPLYAPQGNVRSSANIASPVTIGSGIVLPADYSQWDRNRLRIVLAHEQSHVRQLDFYLQFLAGFYTAVFWFSPLGWWLRSELTRLGEAISDRAGIEAAQSVTEYAETVLQFAAVSSSYAAGVAMARRGNLSKRIEALLSDAWLHSAFAAGRRRALASLVAVPLAFFVATALIRVPKIAAQTVPLPAASRTASPQDSQLPHSGLQAGATQQAGEPSAEQNAAANGGGFGQAIVARKPSAAQAMEPAEQTPPPPQSPAVTPPPPPAPQGAGRAVVPPAAQPDPLPPAPPAPPMENNAIDSGMGTTTSVNHDRDGAESSDFDYHGSSDGEAWAVASGTWKDDNLSNLSPRRRAELERAHQMAHGPFLWFTQKGKSYVVTDPAEIARIESLFQAMSELGREQGALGREQGAFGREQGQLGRQQGQIGRGDWQSLDLKLPDMAKMQAQIAKDMAQLQAEQKLWNAQSMARMQQEMKNAQAELSPEKMAEIQARVTAAENWWTPQRQAELQATLQAAEQRIAEAQKRMTDQQAKNMSQAEERLGEAQSQLGEAQGKLGEAQGRLGEAQGRLELRIRSEVQRIIQESLASGKAVPIQ